MTSSSKGKSIFLYRTDRGRLDRLEAAAKEEGMTNTNMLDRIVDDWIGGSVTPPEKPKPEGSSDNWWQR